MIGVPFSQSALFGITGMLLFSKSNFGSNRSIFDSEKVSISVYTSYVRMNYESFFLRALGKSNLDFGK